MLVTGLDPARVRQVCDDAALGVRLALAEVEPWTTTRWCTSCSCTSCRAPWSGRSPRPSSRGTPDLPPQWKTPSVLPGQGDGQGDHHLGRRATAGATGCLAALAACGACRGCRGGDRHGGHGSNRNRRRKKDGWCGDCCECGCDGCEDCRRDC